MAPIVPGTGPGPLGANDDRRLVDPNNLEFGPQKAYIGAAISAIVAGLSTLYVALDDGIVTAQEGVGIASAVLVSLGAVFGGVYATANKIK